MTIRRQKKISQNIFNKNMKVTVFGGAGFVGSHVCDVLCEYGHEVTVLDGLLPETGGVEGSWKPVSKVKMINIPIEEYEELGNLVDESDAIIDSMGWTRHLSAIKNPLYDMELNVMSHIVLIEALKQTQNKKIIYLGSRGQYGNPNVDVIVEDTPQVAEDIQGIHKTAGELHFRELAKRSNHSVISLRFGNTYGERQPMIGDDIGLFGMFVRDLMDDKSIELYGSGRARPFVYAKDVGVACELLLSGAETGFVAYNLGSRGVDLEALSHELIKNLQTGSYNVVEAPAEIKAIDMGKAEFNMEKFSMKYRSFKLADFGASIQSTVNSIKTK